MWYRFLVSFKRPRSGRLQTVICTFRMKKSDGVDPVMKACRMATQTMEKRGLLNKNYRLYGATEWGTST